MLRCPSTLHVPSEAWSRRVSKATFPHTGACGPRVTPSTDCPPRKPPFQRREVPRPQAAEASEPPGRCPASQGQGNQVDQPVLPGATHRQCPCCRAPRTIQRLSPGQGPGHSHKATASGGGAHFRSGLSSHNNDTMRSRQAMREQVMETLTHSGRRAAPGPAGMHAWTRCCWGQDNNRGLGGVLGYLLAFKGVPLCWLS